MLGNKLCLGVIRLCSFNKKKYGLRDYNLVCNDSQYHFVAFYFSKELATNKKYMPFDYFYMLHVSNIIIKILFISNVKTKLLL